jgi:hypothetical protein
MNFSILSENKSNPSVRNRNYYYTQKTADKVSAEEDEEEYESHHTDGEEIFTTEILSVLLQKY